MTKQRKFVFCDPSLRGNVGHHANVCRLLTREMAVRNFLVEVYSSAGIEQSVRAELEATPLFAWSGYAAPFLQQDRIAGWLKDFETIYSDTLIDLLKIPPLQLGDIVYFSHAMPAHLMALIRWVRTMQPERRPSTFIEFALEPGVEVRRNGDAEEITVWNPLVDARGVLFRHAASHLGSDVEETLFLCTYDKEISRLYALLMQHAVLTVPLPHKNIVPLRKRTCGEMLTVAFLGHQREDKGYQFVPELVRRLLRERQDVRLLVHNGAPDQAPHQQAELRGIAAMDYRLEIDEEPADLVRWGGLLERSDLIVCPYSPQRFAVAYSALASEAIANGVPMVAPAQTTLSALMEEFGMPGTLFGDWSSNSILSAIVEAIERFNGLSALALVSAQQWGMTRGADVLAADLVARSAIRSALLEGSANESTA